MLGPGTPARANPLTLFTQPTGRAGETRCVRALPSTVRTSLSRKHRSLAQEFLMVGVEPNLLADYFAFCV